MAASEGEAGGVVDGGTLGDLKDVVASVWKGVGRGPGEGGGLTISWRVVRQSAR